MTVQSTKNDQTKGDEFKCPCNTCSTSTFHVVMASVDATIGFGPSPFGFRHYQIIRCMGCKQITFRDLQTMPALGDLAAGRKVKRMVPIEHLYPAPISRKRVDSEGSFPERVLRIYVETHSAYHGRHRILTGIGLRAMLETVCKDRGAPGRILKDKIDSLVTMGLLTQGHADFLHSLRILGNEAAHEVTPHSLKKLGVAMDIIEHLLATVYILPKKAGELVKQ